MSIEGIPEGWELVRVGKVKRGEFIVDNSGRACEYDGFHESQSSNYVIIRKIEKPKQYRPFANAAEFEPHRDKWIKRGSKHDTEATRPEGCFRVAAYNDHHYWTAEGICTPYMQAFDDGRCFEDGTPFGVEVTE